MAKKKSDTKETLAEIARRRTKSDERGAKIHGKHARETAYKSVWNAAGESPSPETFVALAEAVRDWDHIIWLELFILRFNRLSERAETMKAHDDSLEWSDWNLWAYQKVAADLILQAARAGSNRTG